MLLQPFALTLSPTSVRRAALAGMFPMGGEDGAHAWYFADPRGLLPIQGLRKNRSLARALRESEYVHTFDRAFEKVVRACQRPSENWITSEILSTYCEIHDEGWAHSSEVWLGERLVGGVYGAAIGGLFCAESMFHTEPEAGKLALARLVEECGRQGFLTMDVQTMTPHLRWLGGYQVSHEEYLDLVRKAAAVSTEWGWGPVQT